MTKSAFRTELVDAWQGEVFGQALMRRLQSTLADADAHEDELRRIERVEGLMAAVLVTVIGPVDEGEAQQAAVARSEIVAARFRNWVPFAYEGAAAIAEPLARFRALVPIAPAAEAEVVKLLVAHEEALGSFLQRAADGMPVGRNDALDAIEHALRDHLGEVAPVG